MKFPAAYSFTINLCKHSWMIFAVKSIALVQISCVILFFIKIENILYANSYTTYTLYTVFCTPSLPNVLEYLWYWSLGCATLSSVFFSLIPLGVSFIFSISLYTFSLQSSFFLAGNKVLMYHNMGIRLTSLTITLLSWLWMSFH